jgi:hypothetical protein
VTVNIAALLVTFPPLLLTTHVKEAPLSAVVVAGVVYDALFAPAMLVVPRHH